MSPATISPTARPKRQSTSSREVYNVHFIGDEQNSTYGNFRTPQEDISDTLDGLMGFLAWSENWNGQGAVKPHSTVILRAVQWITRMRIAVMGTDERWKKPHIVPDQDGDIVFEWSQGSYTLSVYVSLTSTDYLKVWGEDPSSQMEDGEIIDREENRKLWQWLMERA